MADVDMTVGAVTGHASRRGRTVPYKVSRQITGAQALIDKGSALVSADVLQCIDIPIGAMVLSAGLFVSTADTAGAIPASVTVGAAVFTTEKDLDIAGFQVCLPETAGPAAAADTVDITLGTLATETGDWVVDLWCIMVDVNAYTLPTSAIVR